MKRSLANRSSQAAQETAALIEQSANNIIDGKEKASQVSLVFDDVEQLAVQVRDIVTQIASGTVDQTQGIDKLVLTIQDIQRLSQDTTESATQNSHSAKQLQEQYLELHAVLAGLTRFMGYTP